MMLFDNGLKLKEEGHIEPAFERFRHAVQTNPDNALAAYEAAELAFQLGLPELAMKYLWCAKISDPNRWEVDPLLWTHQAEIAAALAIKCKEKAKSITKGVEK